MATEIAGTAVGAPISNQHVGNAGASLLSMWANVSGVTDPNTFPEIYQTYGDGFPLFRDLFMAKGQRRALPSNALNVIEELSDERPIEVEGAVSTAAAGANITIKLAASNYESTKNPVQDRDVILIPAQYLADGQNNSAEYIVMSRTTVTLTNDTLTCSPINVLSELATAIPDGTVLAVMGNRYARGEGQPTGRANVPVQKNYYWTISKETVGLEQDVLATKHSPIDYKGNRWVINRLTAKAERRVEKDLDAAFHHGQYNSNSSVLVGESGITGDDGVLQSGDGMTTLMDSYSMCNYYDTTFEVSHLDIVTDGFISQQIPTADVGVYNGHTFMKNISDVIRDLIAAYSGGTDMWDPVKKMFGISPTALNWNNFNFFFQTISSFSNPSTIGLNTDGEELYEYPASAMFIPDNPITVNKFGQERNVSIPNVGIGYVDYNGENNGKVSGILKGMTNLEGGNLGSDKAGLWYYWMVEEMLFGGAWNQKFYFRKTLNK